MEKLGIEVHSLSVSFVFGNLIQPLPKGVGVV